MNNGRFITGLGIGMVAGGALGMVFAPGKKHGARNAVSRALRSMGDVVDGVSDVFRG